MAQEKRPAKGLIEYLRLVGIGFNSELIDRLAQRGYPDARASHGLVFANMGPGAHATDIAARAGVTKQAIGELIGELEDRGYIRRIPDPEDARAKIVTLTAKGVRLVQTTVKIIEEIEDELTAALGARHMREVVGGMAELAKTFQE